MLDYNMAARGELGLAEYLYRRVRDDIVSGALAAEDRLPSKRALAQHLGVSVVTVENAYAQLVAEGYLEARPRRGFYVTRLPQLPHEATAEAVPAAVAVTAAHDPLAGPVARAAPVTPALNNPQTIAAPVAAPAQVATHVAPASQAAPTPQVTYAAPAPVAAPALNDLRVAFVAQTSELPGSDLQALGLPAAGFPGAGLPGESASLDSTTAPVPVSAAASQPAPVPVSAGSTLTAFASTSQAPAPPAPSLSSAPPTSPAPPLSAPPASSLAAADATPGDASLVADLTRGTVAADPTAARLWERALRQAMAQEPETELFCASPAQGLPRLRRAIARHLEGSRGMRVDPERVVVGAGAQMLYNLVEQLLGDGRVYAVEDPGYARASLTYEVNGARVAFVPVDNEGMSVTALRASAASVAHVMPSHQFPSGRVMSVARRYELLSWAAQEPGRYVVEDDYDCELRLAGRPIPSLASIDATGSVIYLNTFSKSLGSALRMAYLVLPPALVGPYRERLGFYASTVSAPDQVVLARLLESGSYERHVSRYRKRSREVRDALLQELAEPVKKGRLTVEEANSGLHFVLALEGRGVTGQGGAGQSDALAYERAVAARALAQGVRVAPLSSYAREKEHALLSDGRARLVVQYDALTPDVARKAGQVLVASL